MDTGPVYHTVRLFTSQLMSVPSYTAVLTKVHVCRVALERGVAGTIHRTQVKRPNHYAVMPTAVHKWYNVCSVLKRTQVKQGRNK